MKIFLTALTALSSILMIATILLQQGKGADLGSSFGRGAQGGLFTSNGKGNFLSRITSGLVTVFLLSALALSILVGKDSVSDVDKQLQEDSIINEIEALDSPPSIDDSNDITDTTNITTQKPESYSPPKKSLEGSDNSNSDLSTQNPQNDENRKTGNDSDSTKDIPDDNSNN